MSPYYNTNNTTSMTDCYYTNSATDMTVTLNDGSTYQVPVGDVTISTTDTTTAFMPFQNVTLNVKALANSLTRVTNAFQDVFQPRARPPRGFNRYVNASDLMEEFIRFAGDEGVKADDVLDLPIDLFIKWLVIRACEEDQEEPNVTLELPPRRPQPRCLGCQRYMRRDVHLPIHDGRCASRYYRRLERV